MQRTLLTCGVLAGPLFVVTFLVEGALRPGYNPLIHPVSALSLGPTGWTQVANFLVTGLLVIAFGLALRCGERWVIVLIGIGLIGAGVFACDPLNGYPPGTPFASPISTSGRLHNAFSTLVFLGIPIACVLVARRVGGRFARYSVITAVAFLTLFVLAGLGFAQDAVFLPVGGLLQRLCLAIGLGWITALAASRLEL